MASFHFRYAAPLKQATLAEQDAQRALAALLRKRQIFETQLRDMQETIRSAKAELGDRLVGTVDLSAIGQVARYAGDSRLRGQQIVQRLAVLEGQITDARKQLAERTQRRRSFELLRDRDLAEFKRKQRRKETAVLDEVAARRHVASRFLPASEVSA
ncbi:MAG: flagellar export protein FliJ [Planctomycetota bacterium]